MSQLNNAPIQQFETNLLLVIKDLRVLVTTLRNAYNSVHTLITNRRNHLRTDSSNISTPTYCYYRRQLHSQLALLVPILRALVSISCKSIYGRATYIKLHKQMCAKMKFYDNAWDQSSDGESVYSIMGCTIPVPSEQPMYQWEFVSLQNIYKTENKFVKNVF